MTNKKAFTLVELLASLSILGILTVVVMRFIVPESKQFSVFSSQTSHQDQIFNAMRYISRIGKAATSCRRQTLSGFPILECTVDFQTPPQGNNTEVRFRRQNNQLLFEHLESSVWVTKLQYEGVEAFQVCDSAMLAANTCPIESQALRNAMNFGTDRLFRFELGATAHDGNTTLRRYSGFFFRRNPMIYAPGMVMPWKN